MDWTPRMAGDEGPIYRRIAQALRADVAGGLLSDGDRIPPQREIADRLGVTLGTVTRALKEVERWGLIVGHVGRGTFVRAAGAGQPSHPLRTDGPRSEDVDFGLNVPLTSLDPALGPTLAELSQDPSCKALLAYAPARGMDAHRAAGARFLAWHGAAVEPAQVTCCAGAQHAMVVACSAVARPGDTLLTEDLVFPGLRALARMLDLSVVGVASDDEGPRLDALRSAARHHGARALYATPTLHNPTNRTWSLARRQAIAELCRELDVAIIEDEAYRLLDSSDPPTPLAEMAPERTLFIGSFSKAVAAGLRVAYLACPPALADAMSYYVAATVWTACPLAHEIATRWIADGTAQATIENKRAEARRRQAIAARGLPRDRCRAHPDSHHLWLELPSTWTPARFVDEARRRRVLVTGSSAFYVGQGTAPRAVRLSLGAPLSVTEVERGIAIVSTLLERDTTEQLVL